MARNLKIKEKAVYYEELGYLLDRLASDINDAESSRDYYESCRVNSETGEIDAYYDSVYQGLVSKVDALRVLQSDLESL